MVKEAMRIGVFDSGIGGLTVLKALVSALPSVDFIYLGDTARLPYGTKSAETITQYAVQNIEFLMRKNVDQIVVACNSASSVLDFAIPILKARNAKTLPITGVIEAGCQRALKVSRGKNIAILATRATVSAGVYVSTLMKLDPTCTVTQYPCSLLVSLVEEGWNDGPVVESVIRRYLEPILNSTASHAAGVDTIILGCTHFPVLKPAIQKILGPNVNLVDSANAIAELWADPSGGSGRLEIFLTDESEHFAHLARGLMQPHVLPKIQRVNLPGLQS